MAKAELRACVRVKGAGGNAEAKRVEELTNEEGGLAMTDKARRGERPLCCASGNLRRRRQEEGGECKEGRGGRGEWTAAALTLTESINTDNQYCCSTIAARPFYPTPLQLPPKPHEIASL